MGPQLPCTGGQPSFGGHWPPHENRGKREPWRQFDIHFLNDLKPERSVEIHCRQRGERFYGLGTMRIRISNAAQQQRLCDTPPDPARMRREVSDVREPTYQLSGTGPID
jgi:hypothetical protein